jgi:hypothetical protein
VVGPAVETDELRPAVRVELEAELGRDDDLPAKRLERLPDQPLVRERPVDLGGVEEGHAALDRGAEQADHLAGVLRRAIAEAHAHAAEPERRDFESIAAECPFLHDCLSSAGSADVLNRLLEANSPE